MKHTPGKVFRTAKPPPAKPGSAEYRFREGLVRDGILKSVDDDLVRKDRAVSTKNLFIPPKAGQPTENKPWPTWKRRALKFISWLVWLSALALLVYTFVYNIEI